MRTVWPLRLLACVGLFVSAYLLYLKLTGRISYLVGCGTGSGCANVLGSRWSQFFGVPVTAFSAVLYGTLLVATWKPSKPVYAGLAICLAGAALWFYGILLIELKAFCPWCAGAHLIGLCCAGLLVFGLRRGQAGAGNIHLGVVGGALALVVFFLGQAFGPAPDTHILETVAPSEAAAEDQVGAEDGKGAEDAEVAVHARGEGRTVSVFEEKKLYNTSALPHLGKADAPHVIVKYFDYTCASCKDMHADLEAVSRKHPGIFCMIMLPVPLNKACNEAFPPDLEQHEGACELARLGLAAWRAKPEAYPEVHETLFTRPVLTPEIAEIAVAQLVGEEELQKALQDPWVDEVLAADIADFRQLTAQTLAMPKLLVGQGRILHGVTRTPEILLRALEKEFKLPAAP